MSFGSRLRERREAVGLTQKDLGNLLGVSGNAVGNYEKGVSSPNADALYKVFDVLECDANYLFQDEMEELDANDFTAPEIAFIKKYRDLDDYGRETVNYIVDRELIRVAQLKEKSSAPDDAEDEYQMVARGGKVVKPNKPFDADAFKAALDGVEQTENL